LVVVLFALCLVTAAFQGGSVQTDSAVPFQEQPFEQPVPQGGDAGAPEGELE
jgi:hypothetical protein